MLKDRLPLWCASNRPAPHTRMEQNCNMMNVDAISFLTDYMHVATILFPLQVPAHKQISQRTDGETKG